MKTLNTRQWVLYEYLKLKSENGQWRKREQILEDLSEYYPLNNNVNLYYNTAASEITKDIKILNESDVIQKIIISNSQKGIKIATEEEVKTHLNNNMKNIVKRLKKHYNMINKAKLNNQYRLTFGKGYEKLYIESFITEFE